MTSYRICCTLRIRYTLMPRLQSLTVFWVLKWENEREVPMIYDPNGVLLTLDKLKFCLFCVIIIFSIFFRVYLFPFISHILLRSVKYHQVISAAIGTWNGKYSTQKKSVVKFHKRHRQSAVNVLCRTHFHEHCSWWCVIDWTILSHFIAANVNR